MDKQLSSYVKLYKSVIPNDMCNDTVNQLQNSNWSTHKFYKSTDDTYYTNDNEPSFTYENLTTSKPLMDLIWEQISSYILTDINVPWWNSWQGFNLIKFNKYDTTNTMAEHCDHIHDMFDGDRKGIPILTVIGLLNSDFEGGNFIILEDEKINISKGDILIFPSLFLFPHKVTPLTRGSRYSFASWVW